MDDFAKLMGVAFSLLLLGMVLSVGTVFANQFKSVTQNTVVTNVGVIDESVVAVASNPLTVRTNGTLDHLPILVSSGYKLWLQNTSSGANYTMTLNTNYTLNTATGFVNVTASDKYGGYIQAYANYTYVSTSYTATNASSIIEKTVTAFGTFADWLNPLAFISISSFVILLLVGVYLKLRGAIGGVGGEE